MPVAALVGRLPKGHRLYVNPTGAVSMLIETDALLDALAVTAPERNSETVAP